MQQSRSITWRSVLLGILASIFVCAATPYNDFALSDTSVCAGYLPLAAVLILFVLIVGINAPLHRFRPASALQTGELAVIMLMTLVACALPNWGLMRFFIPTPASPFHVGQSDSDYWRAFVGMDLPKWLFPVPDIADGRNSPIVEWFYNGSGQEKIPFGAWFVPLLSWGIFIAAMLATLVAVARLVIGQWVANERLPFPIVQVQAALIEPPEPGRALNAIFRSPALWIGLLGVFFIHSLSAMSAYFPKNVPKIPLSYDLSGLFPTGPLFYLDTKIKKSTIAFTVIGVTYFIRTRTAFSLWASFFIVNLVVVEQQMQGREILSGVWADQHLGACVAFLLGIAWVGRHHWGTILRNAVGLGKSRDHALTFWVAVIGTLVMIGWLCAMKVHPWMAVLIVFFILMAHIVVSRVLAETGLPWYRASAQISQVYTNLPINWFRARDIYFSGIFTVLGPLTTRDGLLGAALHGLGLCKSAELPARDWRKLGRVIAISLAFGFVVAAFGTLYCQYSYPTPRAEGVIPIRNYFGAEYIPKRDVGNALTTFSRGHFPSKPHSPALQMSIGFVVTALLQIGALRWANWPLLPVGYITSHGAFIGNTWFSIFLGWIAKILLVRFGGASLYQRARPFFIGIIFGETLAAAFWLIVNAIVVISGGESQAIKFMG